MNPGQEQRHRHPENGLVGTAGRAGWTESHAWRALYTVRSWRASRSCCRRTGAQPSLEGWVGGRSKREGKIYMLTANHFVESYSRKPHTIVKQLYSNNKEIKKNRNNRARKWNAMLIELWGWDSDSSVSVWVCVWAVGITEMRMLEMRVLGKWKKLLLKQASVSERNLRMFTTKDEHKVSMKEVDSTEINSFFKVATHDPQCLRESIKTVSALLLLRRGLFYWQIVFSIWLCINS